MRPSLAAQVSYRMRTEMHAQAGYAAPQVPEAIQILVNVHGGRSFAESSPLGRPDRAGEW